MTIVTIEMGVPMLVDAHGLIDRVHTMIRKKAVSDRESWIADAKYKLKTKS